VLEIHTQQQFAKSLGLVPINLAQEYAINLATRSIVDNYCGVFVVLLK